MDRTQQPVIGHQLKRDHLLPCTTDYTALVLPAESLDPYTSGYLCTNDHTAVNLFIGTKSVTRDELIRQVLFELISKRQCRRHERPVNG